MIRALLPTAALLWLCATAAAQIAAETAAPLADSMTVKLRQGEIEGARTPLEDGRSFYSFKSIPYAEPPVGTLRLRDPVPAGPWEGVRSGSLWHESCPQVYNSYFIGAEDCLYLDVYTPQPFLTANLPVMVWIHGGAFNLGSSSFHHAMPILSKDVVLVAIQYRLSTLGFLSTEDSVLPGNFGLKDQVLALRWIKDNIQDLGGDPDNVTIFGQNAGASSVQMHTVSPMSEGLFQRAIMQSGIFFMLRDDLKKSAMKVGEIFNCSDTTQEGESSDIDSEVLLKCLQEVPVKELAKVEDVIRGSPTKAQVMLPRVDGSFLPKHPAKLLKEGKNQKVDVLIGTTRDEGALVVRVYLPEVAILDDASAKNFSRFADFLAILLENDDNSRRVFYRYSMDEPNTICRFVKMTGESGFLFNSWSVLAMYARDAAFGLRTYAYELQHIGQYDPSDFYMGPGPNWMRKYVSHLSDLQYLFPSSIFNATSRLKLERDDDLFVSRIMVDLWTNFAATGNPTPDLSMGFRWTPMTESDYKFLGISAAPSMQSRNVEDFEFFRNLPITTNKMLYPERFQEQN